MRCLKCEQAAVPSHMCSVCKKTLPHYSFANVQWRHRSERPNNFLTCSSPMCTNQSCNFCQTCKDPACRKKAGCTRTLHVSAILRSNTKELALFECAGCQCQWTHCQVCNASTDTDRARQRRLIAKKWWTCANCLQKQLDHSNRRHR